MHRSYIVIVVLVMSSNAAAETVILKDGTFVEGTITVETKRSIRIETRFGARTYARRDIERIVSVVDDIDPGAVNRFAELPAPLRAVLNARADYKLARYERALTRIKPFMDQPISPGIRTQIDWLALELHQRMGQWASAKRRLTEKANAGAPRERIRARAHLDILTRNPQYDLRFVGDKHVRNFIRDAATLAQAREPGSLRSAGIMRIALEQYCEQLLVEDALSVKAFADHLDVDMTLKAVRQLPLVGDVGARLPYFAALTSAEASLYKAQSVLGDYGLAFEVDLIRTELTHLLLVIQKLEPEVLSLSPETFSPTINRKTDRLTAAGRLDWRRRCDAFLTVGRPLVRLIVYMVDKAERYPHGLRMLRENLSGYHERYGQMMRAVKRVRNRSRG